MAAGVEAGQAVWGQKAAGCGDRWTWEGGQRSGPPRAGWGAAPPRERLGQGDSTASSWGHRGRRVARETSGARGPGRSGEPLSARWDPRVLAQPRVPEARFPA